MKGSCLCQAVQYEVDALASPIYHCHCQTCRKAHAAAFNSTAGAERSAFRWLRGKDKLNNYESTPGKKRWFCTACGSHLMAEWVDKPYVIVRVATLDEDPGTEVKGHIWTSYDLPWLDYQSVDRFEEKP